MAWAKLDDRFHSHPKLQRAQRQANAVAGVYSRALSYCAANGTDGFVDGFWIKTIAKPSVLRLVSECDLWVPAAAGEAFTVTGRRDSGRRPLPDVTVVCGTDGFFIDDYLHFNPSRDEVRKRAASARADVAQSPDPTRPVEKPLSTTNGFFGDAGWNETQRREALTDEPRARAWVKYAMSDSRVENVAAFSYSGFKGGQWPPKPKPGPKRLELRECCPTMQTTPHTEDCPFIAAENERNRALA